MLARDTMHLLGAELEILRRERDNRTVLELARDIARWWYTQCDEEALEYQIECKRRGLAADDLHDDCVRAWRDMWALAATCEQMAEMLELRISWVGSTYPTAYTASPHQVAGEIRRWWLHAGIICGTERLSGGWVEMVSSWVRA